MNSEEVLLCQTGHSSLYLCTKESKKYIKKYSNQTEREILSSLKHPNIICPIEITSGYILLPIYKGTLYDYCPPRSIDNIRKILIDILSALQYIHSKSIIHGDVKPDNILIDNDGNAILIDFTSAFHKNDMIDGPLTTRGYVAPEIFSDQYYNEKIDIWALGVSILEILLEDNYFRYYKYTYVYNMEKVKNILSLYKDIGKIISVMLDSDPQKRPSASECIQLLTLSQ